MRLNYLKERKKAEYSIMLVDGTLNKHLKEIQETAQARVEQIINQLYGVVMQESGISQVLSVSLKEMKKKNGVK